MNVTRKPLSELRRPERNVRMHTDKQLKEFRRSVEMFGQIRPIVVDEAGVILAGNGLYETLLSMGRTEADCYVVSGLTEAQKKKLMLADGKSVQEIGKQLGMRPEEVFRLSDFSRDDFLSMMTKGVHGYSKAELLTKY